MSERVRKASRVLIVVGMAMIVVGMVLNLSAPVKASWSYLPDGDDLFWQGGPDPYEEIQFFNWYSLLNGDTGLCDFDSRYSEPDYPMAYHLCPYDLNYDPYWYVGANEWLDKGSFTGYAEARFTVREPVNVTYDWLGFRIAWSAYFSNQFSASSYYQFGAFTSTGEVVMTPTYSAYSTSAGEWNSFLETDYVYFNASPDSGNPWTKAEIGELTFRLIVYSHSNVVEEYKIRWAYLGFHEMPEPAAESADHILRPNGDQFIEGWSSYPASPATLADKVNETDNFGDGASTFITNNIGAGTQLAFHFSDLPMNTPATNRYSIELWMIGKVQSADSYVRIAAGPIDTSTLLPDFGSYQLLATGWYNHSWTWANDPATGGPWTVAALNEIVVWFYLVGEDTVNITQIAIMVTLSEGWIPPVDGEDPASWGAFSFANVRLWLAGGGIGWILMLLGGVMLIGAPAIAVLAYQNDGYVESLSKLLIVGFIGFGLFWVGLCVGSG